MAKKRRKNSDSPQRITHPLPFNCTAVSVIIPMYNAEKYVAECLESLLAQTFTNFEVILVDDCSTDSSCAIVENYAEKFGGRLILSHMEKNTGSGALPRNKGLRLSRGEYVFFSDADDMLTKTALEELYTLAKDNDADVVDCEKYYRAKEGSTELHLFGVQRNNFVDKPTLESENLAERIEAFCNNRTWCAAWVKLVKKNLLIEKQITFPHLRIAEDIIWTVEVLCCAKKILHVPNAFYIYRETSNSALRKKRDVVDKINHSLNPIMKGIKFLDNFLNHLDFFKQNHQYRYAVMDYLTQTQLNSIGQITSKMPANIVDEIIRQEFSEDMGEQGALISYCFSMMNVYRLQLIQAHQQTMQFQQFAAHAQEQVEQFNRFAEAANNRIAELEAELKRLQS